jgi:hypothetical protein
MYAVRHDPTRLQLCRGIRGRTTNTRIPTLNPEEPLFYSRTVFLNRTGQDWARADERRIGGESLSILYRIRQVALSPSRISL